MAPDISQTVAELQQKAASLLPNNEDLRENLLQSARSLVQQLETPAERIRRLVYCEPLTFTALRVLIDLNVFKILLASSSPMSVEQLAKSTSAQPELLGRLMKHVATEGYVAEISADEYASNDATGVVASTGGTGTIKDMWHLMRIIDNLPAFLKETKYVNPTDQTQSPFKYAYATDLHYFEYMHLPGREDHVEAFSNHMSWKTFGGKWFEDEALMKEIFAGQKPTSDEVLMVDIGGSSGHDLLGFKKAHSDMTGRLVLQDLPGVINSLDTKDLAAQGVEAMAHDMFTPQPVVGAKVYYLKMVLHDWPRKQCEQALSMLKPVLKAGHSRILLNEIVISDVKAHWFETSLDLLMMAVHAAQERREGEWREIVESVEGLRVRKIWNVKNAIEKVIEIELA